MLKIERLNERLDSFQYSLEKIDKGKRGALLDKRRKDFERAYGIAVGHLTGFTYNIYVCMHMYMSSKIYTLGKWTKEPTQPDEEEQEGLAADALGDTRFRSCLSCVYLCLSVFALVSVIVHLCVCVDVCTFHVNRQA